MPTDERAPQRQDSLDDQMRDAITAVERAGCYDAADWIKQFELGRIVEEVVAEMPLERRVADQVQLLGQHVGIVTHQIRRTA